MSRLIKWIHQWIWWLLVLYCVLSIVYPLLGLAALFCMLAPVATAFFKGRFWCGHFCPRGSFNDIILGRICLARKVPAFIRRIPFKITFLIVLMSAFGLQLSFVWGHLTSMGGVFFRMVLITTGLAIALGITFNQRTWCLICPMGTIAQYISKRSVYANRKKS